MSVELVIEGRARSIGAMAVRRALPSMQRRLVGPFIFLDHMGPIELAPGEGGDVPPHPHIGLGTMTYLFEGELVHRDSVGSEQVIRPGDVNWMIAGKGIVHSERTSPEVRARARRLHGIQSWLALPIEHETMDPAFEHHASSSLPRTQEGGVELRVVAGTAFGATAPTRVLSPTLYVHATLEAGASLPVDAGHEERAVYAVDEPIEVSERTIPAGSLAVLEPRADVVVRARGRANVLLIGGARLDGPRHIYWNFVASSKDRIEEAKAAWREQRFPKIPGDDREFVPLPER